MSCSSQTNNQLHNTITSNTCTAQLLLSGRTTCDHQAAKLFVVLHQSLINLNIDTFPHRGVLRVTSRMSHSATLASSCWIMSSNMHTSKHVSSQQQSWLFAGTGNKEAHTISNYRSGNNIPSIKVMHKNKIMQIWQSVHPQSDTLSSAAFALMCNHLWFTVNVVHQWHVTPHIKSWNINPISHQLISAVGLRQTRVLQ